MERNLNMRKTPFLMIVLSLCLLLFTGCASTRGASMPQTVPSGAEDSAAQQPLSMEQGEDATASTKEPLSLDGGSASSSHQSTATATINGKTNTYQFKSVFENNNQYSVLYVLSDKKGTALSTLTIDIPACAEAGAVYRYDDEYDRVYGNGSVIYVDFRTNKTYDAMNLGYIVYPEEKDSDMYKGINGNKYVIAIDDVSSDGMVISGRYMAEYTHSYFEPGDQSSLSIAESSFVYDRSDAQ
jgi:hypothetical protein